jgi:hypothetical protein
MKRSRSWLILLLFCAAFGTAVYLALRAQADAGKKMPEYSVYSNEPNGLATAALVLRGLGFTPVAATRPVNPDRERGLLIVVEPEGKRDLLRDKKTDLPKDDVRILLNWVENGEDGNTLLLCGRENTPLHRALGVTVFSNPQAVKVGSVRAVTLAEAGGYTDGLDRLEVEGQDWVTAEGGLPLWYVDGQPGAVLLPRGRGQVLVVPDPSLLTHRGLLRAGRENVLFLYNLAALDAQDGIVYFDEYHHGLRSGGGLLGYLYYFNQHWILLQLLVVLAVAGWCLGVRLGPAVPAPKARRDDAVDYASAVARIYQRTGVHDLLGKALARDFLTVLCQHLRLRRNALPAEILQAWRGRYPKGAAAQADGSPAAKSHPAGTSPSRMSAADAGEWLRDLLKGVVELRRGDITERQLLGWVQEFDQFKSEVLSGR